MHPKGSTHFGSRPGKQSSLQRTNRASTFESTVRCQKVGYSPVLRATASALTILDPLQRRRLQQGTARTVKLLSLGGAGKRSDHHPKPDWLTRLTCGKRRCSCNGRSPLTLTIQSSTAKKRPSISRRSIGLSPGIIT